MNKTNINITVALGVAPGLPNYADFNVVPSDSVMKVSLNVPFTSLAGTVVDPDVVTIGFVPPTPPLQTLSSPISFTYTNGATPPDPTYTIVRDAAGAYHADLDNSSYGDGVWSMWIDGAPGSSGLDTTKTKVHFSRSFLVA